MEDEVTRNVKVPDHVTMTVIQTLINLKTMPHVLFPISPQAIWTLEDMGRELYKYNDKGNLLKTIKCWFPIKSAVMASSSEMIVVDDKAHCVKTIDLTKEDGASLLIRLHNTQIPTAVCINNANELVIGMCVDDGTTKRFNLSIYSDSGRKLLKVIETYREDEESKQIFEKPISKIIQNGNGDYIMQCGNEIVTIDEKGNIKWKYSAKQKGNRASRFSIGGIVCDKHNHVLISDTKNSEIDMLDPEGKFLMCVMTSSKLHDMPLALAIDAKQNLWLAQADRSIFIVTYLR